MVQEMRTSKATAFTERDTPMFTCLRMDLPELLPFRRKSDFDRWAGALQAAGLPD